MVLPLDVRVEGQESPPVEDEDGADPEQRKNHYQQLMGSLELLARQNEEQNSSRLLYRITRVYVRQLANFNRLDCKASSAQKRTGLIGRFIWVRDHGLWSNLLFVCSLISLAHLVYATCAHYRVDFALSRMERLVQMVRAQVAYAASSSRELLAREQANQQGTFLRWDQLRQLRELNATVAQRRVDLALAGSPSGHLRFAIENIYVGHILFVVFTYIAPAFYIKVLTHRNQYLHTCLDDYKYELVVCGQLAGRVVRDYQISARNFARCARHLLLPHADRWLQQTARCTTRALWQPTSAELERARQLALHLDGHLASVHLSGQLVPLNRRPEWVASWARQLLVATAVGLAGALVQNAYILGTLCAHSRAPLSRLSWPDLMVFLDMTIVLLCINVATIFYASIVVIAVWDQTRLSNTLRSLMTDYLVATCQRFNAHLLMGHRYQQQTSGRMKVRTFSCWPHQNRSNSDLLELLMHYKLFVRQLEPLRHRLSHTLLTCILILFVLPTTSSVHVPYYPADIDGGFRAFVMVMSLMVGVPTGLLAIHACHMHARCLGLQQMLNNLTAHVAHAQSQPELRFFYDEHLVSILRRESTTERGHHHDPFAISVASYLRFDYRTVLQVYLWFGFILISISFSGQRSLDALRPYQQQMLEEDGASVSGRTKPYVNVLDDPLGLFSG